MFYGDIFGEREHGRKDVSQKFNLTLAEKRKREEEEILIL